MDKLFRPFYNNFMIKSEQRDKFNKIAGFVTCGDTSGGWEVETIIPAHGDIVRGKELCHTVLERHFNIRCEDYCRGLPGRTFLKATAIQMNWNHITHRKQRLSGCKRWHFRTNSKREKIS